MLSYSINFEMIKELFVYPGWTRPVITITGFLFSGSFFPNKTTGILRPVRLWPRIPT